LRIYVHKYAMIEHVCQ